MMDFNQSPLLVIWEATQSCDLACVHCRASAMPGRDPNELTTEEGYDLLGKSRTSATRSWYLREAILSSGQTFTT